MLEITAHVLAEIESLVLQLKHVWNLVYPESLEEAFAGIVVASDAQGRKLGASDLAAVEVERHIEVSDVVLEQLRELVDLFRKKFKRKVDRWLMEISSIPEAQSVYERLVAVQSRFSAIETQAILILSTRKTVNRFPDQIDSEGSDEWEVN
jgi:hypothetical protein